MFCTPTLKLGPADDLSLLSSSLVMGSKPKSTYNVESENIVTTWWSTCESQSMGGVLQQLEYIQNHEMAPHTPKNKEVCCI